MGTITPNMSLQKPTLQGDAGTYDDQLNASLDLLDVHDHAAGNGIPIESAGLDITTDLTLNGTAALINVKALSLTAQATYTVAKSLWVDSDDNELYWRNNAGTDVQITDGNTLNLSIVGGINGDYSSTDASLYYEDAGKRYKMLQDGPSPDHWASVACGDLDLYEKASGITNRVRLQSPGALAASYALILPDALPGPTSLVQTTNSGVVSFNATANRCSPFFTDVTADDYKHSDEVLALSPYAAGFGSVNFDLDGGYQGYLESTGAGGLVIGIPLKIGDRIKSVVVNYAGNSAATINFIEVYKVTSASPPVQSDIGSSGVIATPSSTWTTETVDVTDTTLAAGEFLYMAIDVDAAGIKIGSVMVTFDRP